MYAYTFKMSNFIHVHNRAMAFPYEFHYLVNVSPIGLLAIYETTLMKLGVRGLFTTRSIPDATPTPEEVETLNAHGFGIGDVEYMLPEDWMSLFIRIVRYYRSDIEFTPIEKPCEFSLGGFGDAVMSKLNKV
jgi:hypothetical protein